MVDESVEEYVGRAASAAVLIVQFVQEAHQACFDSMPYVSGQPELSETLPQMGVDTPYTSPQVDSLPYHHLTVNYFALQLFPMHLYSSQLESHFPILPSCTGKKDQFDDYQ